MNCVHKQGLVPGRFPCAGIDYEAFLQKFCEMKVLDCVCVCVCVCVFHISDPVLHRGLQVGK